MLFEKKEEKKVSIAQRANYMARVQAEEAEQNTEAVFPAAENTEAENTAEERITEEHVAEERTAEKQSAETKNAVTGHPGGKHPSINDKKQSAPQRGRKNFMGTVISIVAALVMFELGKSLGMLLTQMILPLFCPELAAAETESAAEAVLQQTTIGGGTLQNLLNAVISLMMQLGGGLICFAAWRKELCWRMGKSEDRDSEKRYEERLEEISADSGKAPRWLRIMCFFVMSVFLCVGLNLLMNGFQLTLMSQTFLDLAAEQAAVPLVLGVLLYGFVAPAAEEILFRGVIYGKIRRMFDARRALILSALFFAVYHGNIVQGLYAGLLGVLLCFLYEKAGSLWVPILFHGIGNLAVYLIFDIFRFTDSLSNMSAILLGFGLAALAGGAFVLCFGKKPSLTS